MPKKKGAIPQYKILYETLRKHITGELYRAGDILPSESELCRTYSLTQPTVRQALALLVNEGYIKKWQGKGSIVQQLPKGLGLLSIEGRLSNSNNNLLNWETRILSAPRVESWPRLLMFTPTNEEIESGAIKIERTRIIEETVVFYEILYIPNINMPRFCSRNLENKSLYDILRKKYQIVVTKGEQKIWSVTGDKKICDLLNIKGGSPILRLERRIDTNRINFSIYSSLYANTDKYLMHGSF
jgi:DNA-binding GntR family transcriptional regulator